jgi:IclR family transcriptional regulator, mhp operon transcriptional activator
MGRRVSQARDSGVRSLERGLALLVAMNKRKLPSVVELARDTRLPRPTIYRLLETLNRAGFVARSSPADRFCLTPKVRSLSDGFLEDNWISEIAAPVMAKFTRDRVWPAALMTFEEGRMLVRETTHEASVLSIDHGMVGRSLPMLRTAAGRCYLAFCSANERRAILEMLACSPMLEDRGARESDRVGALLDVIRTNGFAIQDREINPKTSGMAIPIRNGSRVLGCLSLIWISSALTITQAEHQLLSPLRSMAQRIETAVRERSARHGGYAQSEH